MTDTVISGLIGAGSALLGSVVGVFGALYSTRKQFQREDIRNRETRAAEILVGVEACGFTLVAAINRQIAHQKERVFSAALGRHGDVAQERHEDHQLKNAVREQGENAQRELSKQKALARLFINVATASKIQLYSETLVALISEIAAHAHDDPLKLPALNDMPSKAALDKAGLDVFFTLKAYVDRRTTEGCCSCDCDCDLF